MLKKRNADLSISVIILVVLGLIVLLVMVTIFSNQSGKTFTALNSCESRGGSCVASGSCGSGSNIPNICPSPQICCVEVK